DGVVELGDRALHVDGDLFRQLAESHGGGHFSDVTHLAGKVRGHRVHVVGEVLPGAADAFHLRLTAKTAFGADFAGDARHFGGERVELIDHRVDGVFELEDLALHVDGNLLRQVPTRHSGGDFADVAHLAGEVAGHVVALLALPTRRSSDPFHLRLPAKTAFGAHLAGDARHFGGERVELVHHRVDGILELEDLSADFHGDLLGQV